MPAEVVIGIDGLTPDSLIEIARNNASVKISAEAAFAINKSREIVDSLAASEVPVYGISTGFGALARKFIDADKRVQLQKSLIRSHAAGSGEIVEVEVIRAMMAVRLATMCRGLSGVQLQTAETYAAMLNANITPVVREFGSLGCSGDLAPLSACALAAMGEGEVIFEGQIIKTEDAFQTAGINPVELSSKEGLALINGTDGMLGQLVLAIFDITNLLKTLDITTSLSVEALLGTDRVFQKHLHDLRPQIGQGNSAANIAKLLSDSPLVKSHAGKDDGRVQDAYSLRCAPQVAGAARDTVAHAARVAELELKSIIDNPIVLKSGEISSNGNFHGAPVAHVLDFLAISIADAASMSERRSDRALDEHRSFGLPPFLAYDAGVDSGMMIAQYTQAGLVSEMKRLAVPASVDSIPTSAMQEDHVSMGWHAARKLRKSIDAFTRVIAIELMIAARAVDMRAPLTAGAGTSAAIKTLRSKVDGPAADRWLTPEIEDSVALVKSNEILNSVENAVGALL